MAIDNFARPTGQFWIIGRAPEQLHSRVATYQLPSSRLWFSNELSL